MYVPDNICPHLIGLLSLLVACFLYYIQHIGNVYVKYSSNGAAQRCVDNINGRSFGGQELHAELSPVTEFREALCRQFEKGIYYFFIILFILNIIITFHFLLFFSIFIRSYL